MRLPTLLYHHVGPARSNTVPELSVSANNFNRHISWLARWGYVGVRPSDWLRWLREGTGLPAKSVLITFDDGYADLGDFALPILRRYGFSATIFIVTGHVGGTSAWDEAKGFASHRLMTTDQIRYWASQGIEFGAHSRTHVDLTSLTPSQLSEEILGSKNDLMNLLGSPVTLFAYPYGLYNRDAYECVREGFDLAYCAGPTMEGFNDVTTDRHLQRRNAIQAADTAVDVSCCVGWGVKPINRIRSHLRVRSRFKKLSDFNAWSPKAKP